MTLSLTYPRKIGYRSALYFAFRGSEGFNTLSKDIISIKDAKAFRGKFSAHLDANPC